MTKVYDALLIAERAHRGQMRNYLDEPYIVHPIRVARQLAQFGYNEDVQAAGILHDVAEDTDTTLSVLGDDVRVSPLTWYLVMLLTKWWDDHATAEEQAINKPIYYRGIAQVDEALAIKCVDRADNLDDMIRLWATPCTENTRRWIRRYLRKTHDEFTPLLTAASGHLATPHLAGVLRRAENAILDTHV